MKFECYYEGVRFAYLRKHLDANGFVKKGNHIDGARKVAAFINKDFNVYIDCIDKEFPNSAHGAVKHAHGKPFLYLKTAYSPVESQNIISIIEEGGGKIEPFFKWCGANLNDGFFKQLYPQRKQYIETQRKLQKTYDIGFCCSLNNHPVEKVSQRRMMLYNKLKVCFGDKFFHGDKIGYKAYIDKLIYWKTAVNCPGVGEYTSRIMDACSIGIAPVLVASTYDNAISWKGYFPEIDFSSYWENEIHDVVNNYVEWGEKSLYYYEHFWTSSAIFDFLMGRISEFREKL